MKIGLDLDHTIYGFPEFFKEFIPAMAARGHVFYCTSNHTQEQWNREDVSRLREIGIDPDMIDTSLMPISDPSGDDLTRRTKHKSEISVSCDVIFDDHADLIQPLTKTPIFKVPGKLSEDWKSSRKARR